MLTPPASKRAGWLGRQRRKAGACPQAPALQHWPLPWRPLTFAFTPPSIALVQAEAHAAAAARPPAGLDLRSRETTLAHHAFSGYMRTQVCCLACGDLSKRYELVSNLVLDVSARATTLAAALQRFTATERLDGANKYK